MRTVPPSVIISGTVATISALSKLKISAIGSAAAGAEGRQHQRRRQHGDVGIGADQPLDRRLGDLAAIGQRADRKGDGEGAIGREGRGQDEGPAGRIGQRRLGDQPEEQRRHGQIGDEEAQPGEAVVAHPAQPAGAIAEEQHAEERENEPEDIAHDRCSETRSLWRYAAGRGPAPPSPPAAAYRFRQNRSIVAGKPVWRDLTRCPAPCVSAAGRVQSPGVRDHEQDALGQICHRAGCAAPHLPVPRRRLRCRPGLRQHRGMVAGDPRGRAPVQGPALLPPVRRKRGKRIHRLRFGAEPAARRFRTSRCAIRRSASSSASATATSTSPASAATCTDRAGFAFATARRRGGR